MAIKFDDAYKNKINRIVQNYNRRVRRARTEGSIPARKLPELASSYALKKNYTSRAELDKELKNLEQFRRKAVRRKYNTTLNEYENFLVRNNQREALEFFRHRYDIMKKQNHDTVDERNRLAKYKGYIKFLSQDIDESNDIDAKTMYQGVREYRASKGKQGAGYRGFMSEVEWVMDNVGIDEKDKDAFFKKVRKLTPDEFYDIYMQSNAIEKIYLLVDSPSVSERKLNDTQESAKAVVDALMENIDVMINDVKTKRIA